MKRLAFPSLVASAVALSVASTTAFADPNEYSLMYSKSDFTSHQGVVELHEKIVRTAKAHCPSYFTTRSLADVNACVEEVVNDLVKVIDNPQLTAYAEGDTDLRVAGESVQPRDRS